ncbi:hypothetical protein CC85DRAFT_110242 [Cutaneotrichosporon oleaginosum]|uniref:Uncharacterized protein n=1 Tax=Cutaneotrichosporon oleaginosum TaxID=879819 RepID=A0A0J0XKM0_9TREE|nr:uncharacterized protein CC85DRAFT_110242 [Cutaneotrichosporon oleaginosum]KLT41658.1 hypothetical protein CC85DRAFT_110242 [Cutaneotrichosporon oleaginosum]TXT08107.1 hypothetical protein COLE_05031 [Cutaneotrichosporon oleaginosum]
MDGTDLCTLKHHTQSPVVETFSPSCPLLRPLSPLCPLASVLSSFHRHPPQEVRKAAHHPPTAILPDRARQLRRRHTHRQVYGTVRNRAHVPEVAASESLSGRVIRPIGLSAAVACSGRGRWRTVGRLASGERSVAIAAIAATTAETDGHVACYMLHLGIWHLGIGAWSGRWPLAGADGKTLCSSC